MNNPTYGLVLSGGGVRGLAHLGVIKVLEEEGIYPSYISGTSAGAIVSAFYAAGYSIEDILAFFRQTSIFSINNYAYRKPGLIDTDKFYQIFKAYFPTDRFEDLPKKLYVAATDILAGKTRFFHEGPLIKAVLASAAFPVVLSPITIDGVLYADGGITNNFPVEPIVAYCDKIVGVYVNPLQKIKATALTSSRSVLERAFKIGMASLSIQKFRHCDLVIAPEKLARLGTFSINQLDQAYEIGYEAAQQQLENIRKLKA